MDRETLKQEACNFLESLEKELTLNTPPPTGMRAAIRKIVADAKHDAARPHMRRAEDAFLNYYAIPIISRHMQTVDGIGECQAAKALLCESYRHMPEGSQTPARTKRHPFTKIVGTTPSSIIAQWTGKVPLIQACPDFAFREPFPFKIVFEGKYFETGGRVRAKTELAVNIYQAFFYRGLPYVPPKGSSPAWDYEFACLLAYDASDDGSLKRAWDDLGTEVKRGFWDGANVYVMILRGTGAVKMQEGQWSV
jgi:hypothetical protein